jgi:hypothetical protein
MPPHANANDLVFWQTTLLVPDMRDELKTLRSAGGGVVSLVAGPDATSFHTPAIVRDPDCHALRLASGTSLAERRQSAR